MFKPVRWSKIKIGHLIKVEKDQDFPADILLLKSDKQEGIVFVDTMQLDGETNLKEKVAPTNTNQLNDQEICLLNGGSIVCDVPNENMEKWDGNTTVSIRGVGQTFNSTMKGMMLRGCTLKNTQYCLGVVINTGPHTKIMMNAKKPPQKVSNV